MTSAAATATTTQVYRVYIKATPEAIWDAITSPEWTRTYGYGGIADYDLRPGGAYLVPTRASRWRRSPRRAGGRSSTARSSRPTRRASSSQTWRMLMDPGMQAEGFTRLTYEIEPADGGATRLTVIHDLDGAPTLAAHGRRRARGRGRRRRLGLGPQRPQVAARDRQALAAGRRPRRLHPLLARQPLPDAAREVGHEQGDQEPEQQPARDDEREPVYG